MRTDLQGRKLHLLPFIAREPPWASLQRGAIAEEMLRRVGQSQGDSKAEPPWSKSQQEATLTGTKATGEQEMNSNKNRSHPDTEENVKVGIDRPTAKTDNGCQSGQEACQLVGIQRDGTTKGTPRRNHHGTMLDKTKTA